MFIYRNYFIYIITAIFKKCKKLYIKHLRKITIYIVV